MKNNIHLTNIRCHGVLGEHLQKLEYNLAISSIGEAVRAIEVLSNHRLYKFFHDGDKKGIRYRVLVNGRHFLTEEPVTLEKPETIFKSELCIQKSNIKTIDFVPVLEGAAGSSKDIIGVVLGVVLVVAGFWLGGSTTWYGMALILGGIGLVAAGIINLLSSPPKFDDFRDFGKGGKSSYLFNGPQNTTNEGGPVSIGYGEVLVGSQVVSASYRISYLSIWEDEGRAKSDSIDSTEKFAGEFPMPYFYYDKFNNEITNDHPNKIYLWSFFAYDANDGMLLVHVDSDAQGKFNPVPRSNLGLYTPTNIPPP